MNEILMRKHIKKVMGYGIPKLMAKEIVEVAFKTGKGVNIDTYIQYAISLTYGLNFTSKIATN
jgi:hypothetical protein